MDSNENRTSRGVSRGTWALIGFLAVAAYFLLSEHRAHLFGYLPFLLVAACPLMHLFHGHGHHGSHRSDAQRPAGPGGASEHHTHER
jgi:hypothetical protein